MIKWEEGNRIELENNIVKAKGFGCLWKAPAMPTNVDAGAVITFNDDGSMNLHCGVVEIGQGTKTALAQILAEKMNVNVDAVHVIMDVNTREAPHDWSTVASRGLFMAGRATIQAAEDAIKQLRRIGAIILRCHDEDLEVGYNKVFLRDNPEISIPLDKIVLGYVYPNGNAIGGQIIGRGNYMARRLSDIDKETGKGEPALEWTLGAEAVEVELNLEDYSYKVTKAACTLDVGKLINPKGAEGQVMGSISMALSFASKEGFSFNNRGKVENDSLRNYKILRFGEHPEYLLDFVETPQGDGPYGARGMGEQGVIGIPGALANALSRAAGVKLNNLPLTPEYIWRKVEGEKI